MSRDDDRSISRWGESLVSNYQAYLDFLRHRGQLKQPVQAADVITNDLIADIDDFDAVAVASEAKAYKLTK